jgi:hypothetical protein
LYFAVIAREGGRSSIPLGLVIEPRSCGVLDIPLSRGMTGEQATTITKNKSAKP